MGLDLFRCDNLVERRLDDDVYYRLNARAAGLLIVALDAAAVLDVAAAVPELPAAGDSKAWLASTRGERALVAPSGRVYAYKLATSSAWIVTPEECLRLAAALDRIEASPAVPELGLPGTPPGVMNLLRDFADWNRSCAAHGGYEVW